MSVFLDASVIVAILGREPDRYDHTAKLDAVVGSIFISSLVVFEATIALARKKVGPGVRLTAADIFAAKSTVSDFVTAIEARDAPLTIATGLDAVDAVSRFGKYVGHPAGLNMGDAFAYAAARAVDAPLLYKGKDFAKTDVATL